MFQKLEQDISASLASFTLATPCLANLFSTKNDKAHKMERCVLQKYNIPKRNT
jgi:hypothetical protein